MRLLLVQDRRDEIARLTAGLEQTMFTVQVETDAHAGLQAALTDGLGAMVIESHVGGVDACDVVRELRRHGSGLPVLVLADGMNPDSLVGCLDAGADDVLARPFSLDLLNAHLRALLRRCQATEGNVLRMDDLELDVVTCVARRERCILSLTVRELAVLEFLLRNARRVVSRSEIADAVWGREVETQSNLIDVFIARLRRKVDHPFATPLIHTVVGRGYLLGPTPINGKAAE